MKMLDEVIKALENVALADTDGESEGYFLAVDALNYLKEYRDKLNFLEVRMAEYKGLSKMWNDKLDKEQENPSLTWDELRQMEGKPVWLEYNLHLSDKDARSRSRMWIIVQKILLWRQDDELIYYSGFVFSKEEIDETWQAYRKERTE